MINDESSMYLAVIKDLNKLIRKQMKAIDALMELHHKHVAGSGDVYCYNCQQKYPCLTIQAIEKELE